MPLSCRIPIMKAARAVRSRTSLEKTSRKLSFLEVVLWAGVRLARSC